MRLIDADAIEREGWRMIRNVQIDEKTMEAQIKKPSEFPTIEPRKGKWVRANTHTDGIYECSACLQWTYIPSHPSIYNYCPHCGADMREGGEDV